MESPRFFILLTEDDIPGAKLPSLRIEDNSVEDLKRWLNCRGGTATDRTGKQLRKDALVARVNDYIASGLSRYLIDPDAGIWSRRKLTGSTATYFSSEPFPTTGWCKNLSKIPPQFCYGSIYEYLLERKVPLITDKSSVESDDEVLFVNLPTAAKPLRKGYKYYASDHISDLELCDCAANRKVYLRAKVLSSMKDKTYQTWLCIGNDGLVLDARCQCVASEGRRCNHIAGVLFGILDFLWTITNEPECCTARECEWKGGKSSKKERKPMKVDEQFKTYVKHEFGKVEKKRKRTESSVDQENIDVDDLVRRLEGLNHDTGLKRILEKEPDDHQPPTKSHAVSSVECLGESSHSAPPAITPRFRNLNVSKEEQLEIAHKTIGQCYNPLWWKEKQGRMSASSCKTIACAKQSSSVYSHVNKIINVGKTVNKNLKGVPFHCKFGLEHEDMAREKYVNEKKETGKPVDVTETGLWVSLEDGRLAASPDGLVIDPSVTSREGLVELKGLSANRNLTVFEATVKDQRKASFPLKIRNNKLELKENHAYYWQVQMQMGVLQRTWCDIAVYTLKDIFIQRVLFKKEFWEKEIKSKLIKFYDDYISGNI